MRFPGWIMALAVVPALACHGSDGAGSDTVGGEEIRVLSQEVSDCGGFSAMADDLAPYCDAEVLLWAFDPVAGSLSLTDRRVPLNCCGLHAMTVTGTGGVYSAIETDALPENGMRCRCDCVFDFRVVASPIPVGLPITLSLVRDVADQDGYPKTVWTGTLDLSAGSGSVVIDASPVLMGCNAL